MATKKNPVRYRRLNVPFPNSDEATAAMTAFLEAVDKLRDEHKMPNVYIVISGSYTTDDEGEAEFIFPSWMGDRLKALPMAAFAYGYEKREHEESLGKFLAGKLK